jgi:AcrR family transcriptional regulator
VFAAESPERLRKRPSQARSRETVGALLEAADRLLRRDGYTAASTNRIARVAGFSVGSLYQYFRDKEALIGALIDRDLQQEARRVAAALPGEAGDDIAAGVRTCFEALVSERLARRHLHRALADHAGALCAEPPLVHLLRLQGDVLLGVPVMRRATIAPLQRQEAAIFLLCRLAHCASYRYAVEEPPSLGAADLGAAVARSLAGAIAERTQDDSVRGRVTAWADRAALHASPDETRAAALAEAERFLRERGGDRPDLAARAFVDASLYDVVWLAVHHLREERIDRRLVLGFVSNAVAANAAG